MELGALVCTPRNPQCLVCPVRKLCVAFKEERTEELPNLGKRETATARRFMAFVIEHSGKFLVRQRPPGVVNAHLWEFPNFEVTNALSSRPSPPVGEKVAGGRLRGNVLTANSFDEVKGIFKAAFGIEPGKLEPLHTIKHSITRYRITLEAFHVRSGGRSNTTPTLTNAQSGPHGTRPFAGIGIWKTPAQIKSLAFASAHLKVLRTLAGTMKA